MYLIVLSPLPLVKRMKEERRCLCLKDKAEALCYDLTLASYDEGGEGVAGCEGIITQAETDMHECAHALCVASEVRVTDRGASEG